MIFPFVQPALRALCCKIQYLHYSKTVRYVAHLETGTNIYLGF